MNAVVRYLAGLTPGRVVLWCYLAWYLATVAMHFDPSPRLWLTSAGLSAIIGIALWISTSSSSSGTTALDRWQVARLFAMPFCVSSFSALVKDAGYVLVFPPTVAGNLAGAAAVGCVLGLVAWARRR